MLRNSDPLEETMATVQKCLEAVYKQNKRNPKQEYIINFSLVLKLKRISSRFGQTKIGNLYEIFSNGIRTKSCSGSEGTAGTEKLLPQQGNCYVEAGMQVTKLSQFSFP